MTEQFPVGVLVPVGRHVYGRCAQCLQVIRWDKPIIGSLHLCTPSAETQGREKPQRRKQED